MKKLRASSDDAGGINARTFIGEGNRQYLTGLNLGGRNILILLDGSSSMLAEELVNVIRLSNMDDTVKREATKWRRAVNTVDWLTAQLPVNSQYQVYGFNTAVEPVLEGTEGSWLEVADQEQLDQVVEALERAGARQWHQPGKCVPGGPRHVAHAGQHLPDHRRIAHPGRNRTPGQYHQRPRAHALV